MSKEKKGKGKGGRSKEGLFCQIAGWGVADKVVVLRREKMEGTVLSKRKREVSERGG